ncbi:MAG: DUF4474 domain-containing protein [Oscillospiraceae bacterium]|nr:DUF4474 domain-containing protein [Oscillospiraceae bacterium]
MKRLINSVVAFVLCFCMIASTTAFAFAADLAKPATIKVTAATDTKITLKWSAVKGATGYTLYRRDYNMDKKGWDDWKQVKKAITSTSYTDRNLKAGYKYIYRVTPYYRKNVFSDYEYGETSKQVAGVTKPKQVTGLKSISVGDRELVLGWNKTDGASGYQIYQYDAAKKTWVRLGVTKAIKFTVKNLSPYTSVAFKVRAYHQINGVTYGDFSSTLNVTTKPDDVRNFKLAKASQNSYTLTWSASSGVTGYQLGKYDKEEGAWKVVKTISERSYTVNGLYVGDSDLYKIRSYIRTADGKYVYGVWSEAVVGGTIPKAPQNLKAAANTDLGLALTWDEVENAAGYEVYLKEGDGAWHYLGTARSNNFTHNNLTEKRFYTYKVRAFLGSTDNRIYGNFGKEVQVFYEPVELPESPYPDDWDETGVIGYLYDPDEQCFYTAADPWQRNFGYNELYDNTAFLIAIFIETKRLKFNYGGKDWMIQIWKGQYGYVLYGAEIGVYTKDPDRQVEHYDCASDDDKLMMEMTVYQQQEVMGTKVWTKAFHRPYNKEWWITGFVPGNKIGRLNEIRVLARITMRDYDMLNKVKAELERNELEYIVNGLDITFIYE